MKFKIDENLPIELANLLQDEGYDASTIYAATLKKLFPNSSKK